jgi:hypothetical protein
VREHAGSEFAARPALRTQEGRSMELKPFRIHVEEQALVELELRLERTRFGRKIREFFRPIRN